MAKKSDPAPPADFAATRVRRANDRPIDRTGEYVLLWMQAYRRLSHNHALDCALRHARFLGKPLVVYEGLKLSYPWANARFHRFVLDGVCDNAKRAAKLGINYWPFVETPGDAGRGLLRKLAERACLVVTDDQPCFIHPAQTAALASKTDAPVWAVDSNGVVPLSLLGPPVAAAAHLRPRIHRLFPAAWPHRADAAPEFPPEVRVPVDPPFTLWKPTALDAFVRGLPVDQSVPPVPNETGGTVAARSHLQRFVTHRMAKYADFRSPPTHPDLAVASELSAHLHFGFLSIEEVVAAVLKQVDGWSLDRLGPRNKKSFYTADADPNADAFLDEAITWRDLGYHWHSHRHADTATLEQSLPPWALATLTKHAADRRTHVYTPDQFERADTHDPLWNAAQRELVHRGRIQNYLRMLWGKKVLEWSATPAEAYRTLVHLNNKYALDGRDPNSYTGILWTFGLFDRPWPPERPVYGVLRYMTSESAARKFKLAGYRAYADALGD